MLRKYVDQTDEELCNSILNSTGRPDAATKELAKRLLASKHLHVEVASKRVWVMDRTGATSRKRVEDVTWSS